MMQQPYAGYIQVKITGISQEELDKADEQLRQWLTDFWTPEMYEEMER